MFFGGLDVFWLDGSRLTVVQNCGMCFGFMCVGCRTHFAFTYELQYVMYMFLPKEVG